MAKLKDFSQVINSVCLRILRISVIILLCLAILLGNLGSVGYAQTESPSPNVLSDSQATQPQFGVQRPIHTANGEDGARFSATFVTVPESVKSIASPNVSNTQTQSRTNRFAVRPATTLANSSLQMHPEYLQFSQSASGLLPETQPLRIASSTGNYISFTIEETIPWLSLEAISGSADSTPFTTYVTVNTTGLTIMGSPYTGVISISNDTDPSDTEMVHVRLSITDQYTFTTLHSWDAAGRLHRRIKPDGSIIDYEYDAVSQLVAVRYEDGSSVTYTYDGNGNRTSMTDSLGTTYYAYDVENRLIAVTFPGLNPVQYDYDNGGNLISLTYPDGRAVAYTYDAANRMTSVNDGDGVTSYSYDPTTGLLSSQVLPNGVTTTYAYDADGRLTDVTHRKVDNSLLMAFHYTMDANGMRTEMRKETTSSTEITSYAYDDLLRLIQVTYPDGRVVTYTYDALGNRLQLVDSVEGTIDYFCDADNRLLLAGDESFEYDANGNTIRRTSPTGTIEYTWDDENRLVGYTDNQHEVQFEYDGDGNRVAKIVDGVRTNYVNDVSGSLTQVLLTSASNGSVDQQFIYGLDRLGLNDGGVSNWRYYIYDNPLRSVSGVLDTTGNIVTSVEYDAFGAPIGSMAIMGQPFAYNGETYDAEMELIFLRARYYDPALGRFLTKDVFSGQLSNPSTLNLYVYAINNPVNMLDPGGNNPSLVLAYIIVGGTAIWFLTEILKGTHPDDPSNPILEGINAASGSLVPLSEVTDIAEILIEIPKPAFIRIVNRWNEEIMFHPEWGENNIEVSDPEAYKRIEELEKKYGEQLRKERESFRNDQTSMNPISQFLGVSIAYAAEPDYISSDLGGVALNKTAELLLSIDDLTGATYDPKTGQIILYGTQDVALPEMSMDDVTVAANSIFSWEDPAVSIDPPIVENLFTVRYEGPIEETKFGYVLFEADRVMKTLAMGKDNITLEPVTSSVPGFQTMLERELASGDCIPGTSWSDRFWFQPKEIKLVQSSDGQSMVFDTVSIELLTEYTLQGGIPGQELNPEAEAFATHFTEHYDEFAEEFPIFQELKRLAKVVAVVRWIRDNNIHIDLGWLEQYDLAYFDTPETTPATTVEGSSGSCIMTIEGGAALTTPNDYIPDDPENPIADPMAEAAITNRPTEEQFSWEFQAPEQALSLGSNYQTETTQTAVAQYYARSRFDGNLSFSQTDLSYPVNSEFDLELIRYYDSFSDLVGGFGLGWYELPYSLRFTEGQRTFTFGGDPTPWELYPRLWLAERPAGREDEYELVGASSGLPFYERIGSEDRLWAQTDGSYLLAKVEGDEITFDGDGRVTSVVDRNGKIINYFYDTSDRLMSIEGPNSRVITLSYSAEGCITNAVGPGGRTVTYTYDTVGDLVIVSDQAGRVITYTYDSDHRLSSITDPEGNLVFTANFDIYNRVTSGRAGIAADFSQLFNLAEAYTETTDPYGGESIQRFDDRYRLIEAVDSLGNQTQISYAGEFGPELITNEHGVIRQIVYDSYGNPIITYDGTGARTDFWYDGYQRLVAMRDPESIETAFAYGANHNLTTVYHDVELILDGNGELVSWYYSPDNLTTFTYDQSGNLETATDPLGHTTTFDYNLYGQLTNQTQVEGASMSLTYDERSRLDALHSAGSTIDFFYNDADEITSVATIAGAVDLSYDSNGNLINLTDAEGHTTDYIYDGDNNLVQVHDADGQNTMYNYDVLGKLSSAILPNGTFNAYEYDELGRLAVKHHIIADAESSPCDFVKNSPAKGAFGLSTAPILNWTASINATNYEYCYDFTDNDTCDGNWITTTKTIANLIDLNAGTKYYWQVRARNAAGTTDASGGWWSFTSGDYKIYLPLMSR